DGGGDVVAELGAGGVEPGVGGDAQGGHGHGGDEAGPQRGGGQAEALGGPPDDLPLDRPEQGVVAGADGGLLGGERQHAPEAPLVEDAGRQQRAPHGPERRQQRLAGGSLGEHRAEGGQDLVGLVEDRLVLGGEVAEEGARRDLGGRGDVLDRRRRV